MRGELDDALARMARREALQRRRASEPAARKPVAREPAARGRSPVDEVTEAVQQVVAQNPALAVTMWVADGPTVTALHVAWADGRVTVRPAAEPALPTAGEPPRSWPMSVKTVPAWATSDDPPADDAAARLADLIRRDPSLLGRIDDEP